MTQGFDPGPLSASFLDLMDAAPGVAAYPYADFRFEWGPVFYRGRLDGTARVLVLGQDPGQHECIARRAMVGEAGRRVQGFLARLGITRSYLVLNAFLCAVARQQAASTHRSSVQIQQDRDAWLTAVFDAGAPDVVVAFGRAAEAMYLGWEDRHGRRGVPFEEIPHPTSPRAAAGVTKEEATRRMLVAWSDALERLFPHLAVRDQPVAAVERYGDAFAAGDLPPIPMADLPAGSPAWMSGIEAWADRGNPKETAPTRARIVVTVPPSARGWV
jgi:uracil-DNA glycosylase